MWIERGRTLKQTGSHLPEKTKERNQDTTYQGKKTAAHLEVQETRRTLLLRETQKHERNQREGNVRSATKRRANRDERFRSKLNPGDAADVTERTLSYGQTNTLQSTWENTLVHRTHNPHFCSCLNLWSQRITTLLSARRDPSCRPMPR